MSVFVVPAGFVALGAWRIETITIIKILLVIIAILILAFGAHRAIVIKKSRRKKIKK